MAGGEQVRAGGAPRLPVGSLSSRGAGPGCVLPAWPSCVQRPSEFGSGQGVCADTQSVPTCGGGPWIGDPGAAPQPRQPLPPLSDPPAAPDRLPVWGSSAAHGGPGSGGPGKTLGSVPLRPLCTQPPGDASIHCRARCVHRGSVLPNVCLSSLDDTSVRMGRARETRGQSHGREQTSAQNHLGSCLQRSARGGRCLGGAGFAPSPRGCPQAADRPPPTPSCHGLSVSLFQMLRADGVAPSAVRCLASSRPPGRSSCGMCGGSPGV